MMKRVDTMLTGDTETNSQTYEEQKLGQIKFPAWRKASWILAN